MAGTIERNGYISNVAMWADIAKDLANFGLGLTSVNGTLTTDVTDIEPTSTKFVLDATAAVDPIVATQPWRLFIETSANFTAINVATPTQISDIGEVSKLNSDVTSADYAESGQIGRRRLGATPAGRVFFYHKGVPGADRTPAVPSTLIFVNPSLNNAVAKHSGDTTLNVTMADANSMPCSYRVTVCNHGFAICTWVEGQDDAGCKFNWLVVQRPVLKEGTVITTGKAPLFCLYSDNGGGSPTASEVDYFGIMRFTVRETDVNAPARPVSAVIHSADAFAVMNPLQQVCFTEDRKFDLRFPQGFNSHRYSYPYELDLIGYGSADVISQYLEIPIEVFGENRKYKAMNANSNFNKGMRIVMLVEGAGVTP